VRELEIVIEPDGKSYTIEAFGFKGQGCKNATQPYTDALGQPTEVNQKMEIYESDTTKPKPRVGR